MQTLLSFSKTESTAHQESKVKTRKLKKQLLKNFDVIYSCYLNKTIEINSSYSLFKNNFVVTAPG